MSPQPPRSSRPVADPRTFRHRGRRRPRDECVLVARLSRHGFCRTCFAPRGSRAAAFTRPFGDKHSLFLRALDRYIADALTRMDKRTRAPQESRSKALRTYLAGYVERTSASQRPARLPAGGDGDGTGRAGCGGQLAASRRFLRGHGETEMADTLSRANRPANWHTASSPQAPPVSSSVSSRGCGWSARRHRRGLASQATADALLDRFLK